MTWIRHTNDMHLDQSGSGSGRLAYDDPCTDSTIPSGASSSGQLTHNATKLRRELGGTSASSYITPSVALDGPLILEVVHENIEAYTAGSFLLHVVRDTGSVSMGNAAYQNDGNLVATIDGSSRSASGTTTTAGAYVRDDTGNMHRTIIAVDDLKVIHMALGQAPGGGAFGPVSENSGRRGMAGARYAYTGTLAAGDMVHFTLSTGSTRKVGIYLVRIWRGAIAP